MIGHVCTASNAPTAPVITVTVERKLQWTTYSYSVRIGTWYTNESQNISTVYTTLK